VCGDKHLWAPRASTRTVPHTRQPYHRRRTPSDPAIPLERAGARLISPRHASDITLRSSLQPLVGAISIERMRQASVMVDRDTVSVAVLARDHSIFEVSASHCVAFCGDTRSERYGFWWPSPCGTSPEWRKRRFARQDRRGAASASQRRRLQAVRRSHNQPVCQAYSVRWLG